MLGSGSAGIDVVTWGELKYIPAVEYGWLKEGAGEGSWISFKLMLTHKEFESVDEVVLGLDGRTLHVSTGAVVDDGSVGADHQLALAGELGNKGGGRTTSTMRGGGGSKGRNIPRRLFLTSSLFPHSSSPAPSSSRPSRAETCVRYTNLLMA